MADLSLFDAEPYHVPAPEPAAKLTGDARRTQLQGQRLAAGIHPLQPVAGHRLKVHPDAPATGDRHAPGPRCGTCWFRQTLGYHNRAYAKCLFPESLGAEEVEKHGYPRVSHGAASDVRAFWPACTDYSPGDSRVSDDAARWIPEYADA